MAGIGERYTLSEDSLREQFEKAKSDGADFLVVYNHSSMSVGRVIGGFLDMIDSAERALPVHKDTQFDDLLTADVGGGLLHVQAVYDLSREFKAASWQEREDSVNMLDQDAVNAAMDEFSKRYYYREYEAKPFLERLFTSTPAKPSVLKL